MRTSLAWFAAVVAAFALVAACGTPSKPHVTNHDGGSGTFVDAGAGLCTDSAQCATGTFCIGGHCGTCDSPSKPLQCTGTTYCNRLTHDCEERVADGGTSGGSGSTGTTGTSGTTSGTTTSGSTGGTTGSAACTTRSECPGAEACLDASDAGFCATPAADAGCNTNNDCVKAEICQAHVCVTGCLNDLDCHGTSEPVCVLNSNPGVCGPCTLNTQCQANENCQSGQCVPKQTCSTAADCGDLGCVGGYCSPCTQNTDCASGDTCNLGTGHCEAPATGCTSDSECQSANGGSLAWYCGATPSDGGVRQCAIGCVPDSQCGTPQTGCCDTASGQTCDSTTHTCVQGGTTTSSTGTTGTTTSSTTSSTGSTGTTSTSSSGSGSSSGTTTTGSSGSTGGTGSTPICGSCTRDSDCASGYCNLYGYWGAFCDAYNPCSMDTTQCDPVTTCDSYTDSCVCPPGDQGYFCAYCSSNSDCGTGGLCYLDANANTVCSTPCDASHNCSIPGSTCHKFSGSNYQCVPSSSVCY